jgi:hypothetical protein
MRSGRLRKAVVAAVSGALVASPAAIAADSAAAALYFNVKSPVTRGELAHVVVQGLTGLCRISVSRGGSPMRIRPLTKNPLRPKLSSGANDERVAWQWRVPTSTPLGLWQVRVNCGRAATLHKTFSVTR